MSLFFIWGVAVKSPYLVRKQAGALVLVLRAQSPPAEHVVSGDLNRLGQPAVKQGLVQREGLWQTCRGEGEWNRRWKRGFCGGRNGGGRQIKWRREGDRCGREDRNEVEVVYRKECRWRERKEERSRGQQWEASPQHPWTESWGHGQHHHLKQDALQWPPFTSCRNTHVQGQMEHSLWVE